MSNPTVLIVGAGPTGLTLACELARLQVPFRIIDQADRPSLTSKALAVHARTLEHFDQMGLAHTLHAAGVEIHTINVYAGEKQLIAFGFDQLDSNFPFILSLPQSQTEHILTNHLISLNRNIERGCELIDFTQYDAGVSAQIKHHDGSLETVETKWLVGCDGAHSTVRKRLELPFAGHQLEETFILADVKIDWTLDPTSFHSFFSDDGLFGIIPMPGQTYRIVANVTKREKAQPESDPTLEDMQILMNRRTSTHGIVYEPTWFSRFRIHQRMVPRYRVQNVLLAGDAAHIHSPAGGQGMNTGIQDAVNLAWKLALVTHGHAPETLLDSYHAERHPIGKALLDTTERTTRMATLRHPVARAVRDHVASWLTSLSVVQHRVTEQMTMLDINYRESPIIEEHHATLSQTHLLSDTDTESPSLSQRRDFSTAPHAGDHAPDGSITITSGQTTRLFNHLEKAKHNLLIFDGLAPTPEGYHNLQSIASSIQSHFGNLVATHLIFPYPKLPSFIEAWYGIASLSEDTQPAITADAKDPAISLVLDPDRNLHNLYGALAECLYLIRPRWLHRLSKPTS